MICEISGGPGPVLLDNRTCALVVRHVFRVRHSGGRKYRQKDGMPLRRVFQSEIAAMIAHNLLRDGQPKASAVFFAEAHEWIKYLFLDGVRNSHTIVGNAN